VAQNNAEERIAAAERDAALLQARVRRLERDLEDLRTRTAGAREVAESVYAVACGNTVVRAAEAVVLQSGTGEVNLQEGTLTDPETGTSTKIVGTDLPAGWIVVKIGADSRRVPFWAT